MADDRRGRRGAGARGRRRSARSAGDPRAAPVPWRRATSWRRSGTSRAVRRAPRGDPARAFLATGAASPATPGRASSGLLDDYARRWSSGYTRRLRGDTRARRSTCGSARPCAWRASDERRDALRALTDVFAHADNIVVVQAVNAAQELPSLERVTTSRRSPARCRPPPIRGAGARRRAARRARRGQGADDTGQWPSARRKVAPLIDAARVAGHGGLLAEVLEQRAWLEERSGDERASSGHLRGGGVGGDGGPPGRHRAQVRSPAAVPHAAIRSIAGGDAEHWGRLGEALLRRLGPGHERAASWLMHNRGLTLLAAQATIAGRARRPSRAGLALKQQVLPHEHPDMASSWNAIVTALIEIGDYTGALAPADKFARHLPGRPLAKTARCSPTRSATGARCWRCWAATARPSATCARDRSLDALVGPDHPWVAYALTRSAKTWSRTAVPPRRSRRSRGRSTSASAQRAQSRAGRREPLCAGARALARWRQSGRGAGAGGRRARQLPRAAGPCQTGRRDRRLADVARQDGRQLIAGGELPGCRGVVVV